MIRLFFYSYSSTSSLMTSMSLMERMFLRSLTCSSSALAGRTIMDMLQIRLQFLKWDEAVHFQFRDLL